MLPAALAAMGNCPQWILWKLVPRVGEKPLKIPMSPRTGKLGISAHDPQEWTTHDDAQARIGQFGATGVAFVFTEGAGFWFLDIDDALDGAGQWSTVATTLCQMLHGAAIEISQSGRGLHIFGRGVVPAHGCKNGDLKLEFYHTGRFVALTGYQATGSCEFDASLILPTVVSQYFPVDGSGGGAGGAGAEAWADVADPTWRGPAADDELLRRMFNARASFGQVVQGRATPKQLWENDAAALGVAYPDSGGRAYDASSADAALAQCLAFWTGKNTERMRRMMWQSGLRREKWDKHKRYLWMTVTSACARQQNVYTGAGDADAPREPATVVPQRAVAAEQGGLVARLKVGSQLLTGPQQIEYFANCIYVLNAHQVYTPMGLLDPDQFKVMYGGFEFMVDSDGGGKTSKCPWETFVKSRAVEFPKVAGTCFRPEIGAGGFVNEDGRQLLNTYVPIATRRVEGDPSRFLRHLERMLPIEQDRVILLSWMAAVVQRPGIKLQWWPVIQGAQGNGKSMIGRIMEQAVGRVYTHMPKAAELGKSGMTFTAWVREKLLLVIEEIKVDDKVELLQALLDLVTNDRIEIQGKGENQVMGDNRANGLMLTNWKDAIPVTADTRRYCILYCAQQTRNDIVQEGWIDNYFPALYDWLRAEGYAIITDYLHTYQIPAWMESVLMTHAPETSATMAARFLTMGKVEQEIVEAVEAGLPGFCNGWVSSLALDRLLKDKRLDQKVALAKRRSMMQTLGYDWHPALPEGRAVIQIMGETSRPKLYIRHGHLAVALKDPEKVCDLFIRDQTPTFPAFTGALKHG